MFQIGAYDESQDSASLVNVAAVADQVLTINGDQIRVPSLNFLKAVMGIGVNITQMQLQSPSMNERSFMDIAPLNVNAEPLVPTPLYDLWHNPRELVFSEPLVALAAESGAGATRCIGLVWFGDNNDDIPAGPIETVRFTAATTLVADAWTLCPITFSQTLHAGRYAIVGLRAESAGPIAARLVIPGQTWRPGVVGYDAVGDVDLARFRYGNAGVFGEFEYEMPPQLECLSVSADTAEAGYLDLVYIGGGASL